MALTKKDKQFIFELFNIQNKRLDERLASTEKRLNLTISTSINALKIYIDTYLSRIDDHEARILRLEDKNEKDSS